MKDGVASDLLDNAGVGADRVYTANAVIGALRDDNLSRGGIERNTKRECLEGIECGPVVATKSRNQRIPGERVNVPRGIDSSDAIQRRDVNVVCGIER